MYWRSSVDIWLFAQAKVPAKLVDSSMIEHATQCCVMSTDEIDQLGLGSREKKSYPLHQDEVRTYAMLYGVTRWQTRSDRIDQLRLNGVR